MYISELGTYSCLKEVADCPSVLSPGRPRNEMGYSYSWLRGENPMFTRGHISIKHNLTKFIPPVAVTQALGCNRCGRRKIQVKRKATLERKEPAVPNQRGAHNQFVHFPKKPKSEECKMTVNTIAGSGKPSTP